MPHSTLKNTFSAARLRKLAEERMQNRVFPAQAISLEAAQDLLHELQVQKLELEIQNEELRHSQAELESLRTRYFDLYELAPVGYLKLDEKGIILEANLTAVNLFATTRRALLKRPFSKYIVREDQGIYYRNYKTLFETGGAQTWEIRLKGGHDAPFWVRIDVSKAQDQDGAPICLAVLSDISERKQFENTLLKSESVFHDFIEKSQDAIVLTDEQGIVTHWNQSAEKTFGYPRAESIGLPSWEIQYRAIPTAQKNPQIAEYLKNLTLKLCSSGVGPIQNSSNFNEIQLADGTLRLVHTLAFMIPTEKGFMLGSIARDVTESQRAETLVKENQVRLATVLEASNLGVWEWDVQSGQPFFDERWAQIAGYQLGELQPVSRQTWTDLIHPADMAQASRLLEQHLRNETEFFEFESRVRHKSGQWIWVLDRGRVAARAEDGTPLRMLGTRAVITERKRIQNELKESEFRFRQVMDGIHQVVYLIDATTNALLYISPAYEKIWGRSAQSLAENMRSFIDAIDVEDLPNIVAIEDQQFQGLPTVCEYRIIRPDGSRRWIRDQGFPVFDEYGHFVRISGIAEDITAAKEAELKLKQAEERFRSLFENAPVMYAVIFYTTDGPLILDCNEKFLQVLGYQREEVIRQPLARFYAPAFTQVLSQDGYQRFLAHGADGEERELLSRDGQAIPCIIQAEPIYDENGEATGIRATFIDIRSRKEAEQALAVSQKNYRDLVEFSQTNIAVVDTAGRILFANQKSRDTWQTLNGERTELTLSDLFPPELVERYLKNIQLVIESQQPLEDNQMFALIDGQKRWFHLNLHPMQNSAGQVDRLLVNALDITERVLAQEDLRQSEEKYRLLTETQDSFISTVDENGTLHYVNQSIAAALRHTPAEMVGRNLSEFFPPSVLDAQMKFIREVLASGQSAVREMGTPGSLQYWYRTSIQPIRNAAGEPVLAFINSIDITETKRNQAALERSNQRLMALRELDQKLLQSRADENAVIANALQRLMELIPCREANIIWLTPGSNSAELAAHCADGVVDTQLRYQFTPEAALLEQIRRQESSTHSLTPDNLKNATDRLEYERGIRSLLRARLLVQGQILGWLVLESDQPEAFTKEQMEIASEFATLLALNFHQQQLAEENRSYTLELEQRVQERTVEIQAAYQRLELVSNSAGIGIWDWDLQSDRQTWDKNLFFLYGLSPETIQPNLNAWEQRVHPEDLALEKRFTRNALVDKQPYTSEYRMIWPDESMHYIKSSRVVICDDAGQPSHIIGIDQEVTDRKLAELLLSQSESTYRALFEHSSDAIFLIDPQGAYLSANGKAAELLGYNSPEEIVGTNVFDILAGDPAHSSENMFIRMLTGETIPLFESSFRTKHGDLIETEVRLSLVNDELGHPKMIQSLIRDISARKQADQALRASEAKNRALLAAIPDNMFVQDQAGTYLDYHAAQNDLLVSPPELFLGRNYREVLPPELVDVFQPVFKQAFETGQTQVMEYQLEVPGGIRDFETRLVAFDHDRILSLVRDITERKKVDHALRRANAEMERALRMKDEFLANMSHELRTPLTGILGISESLEDQTAGPLNDKQLRYLRMIHESGHHLLELINDILDLAKIGSGRLELNLSEASLESVCQSSLRMVKELALKKQQSVSFKFDERIPRVRMDERRIKQMLVNLLSNAVKFTPFGGQIGLEVTANPQQQLVDLTVWDNGIGIKDEDLPLLFQPFVQLNGGLAREYSGTGLGLALVAQMTRLHGGSISVKSQLGQGSRFTISIPCTFNTVKPEKTTISEAPHSAEIPHIKAAKNRLLLVEDTEEITFMLTNYLEMVGYQVTTAVDGQAALARINDQIPDLILMDIYMPVMDGFDATRLIRSDPATQHIPIIALTALAMPGDRERCLEAGMDDYLSKPIDLNQLAALIAHHLGIPPEDGAPK